MSGYLIVDGPKWKDAQANAKKLEEILQQLIIQKNGNGSEKNINLKSMLMELGR